MSWDALAGTVQTVLRMAVLAAVAGAAVVALTHAAVRARRLPPFGAWPRFVRRTSDPLLRPIERRLVRAGRNPQDAGVWLVGLTVGAGIVLLSLAGWVTGWVDELLFLADGSPRAWARWGVARGVDLLMLALIMRVVASWFGRGEHTRWLRPAYLLTDWLLRPIRRLLPTFGPIDLSPLVAYVALIFLRGILLSLLL